MEKITFELLVLDGCAVLKRLQMKCNIGVQWNDVMKKFTEISHPDKIASVRYRDSDGDMITIANDSDYREALKFATSQASDEALLSCILAVEKIEDTVRPHSASVSTSEASVSTMVSSFSTDSFDLASLKQEIFDSVLHELRKDQPKKSPKKKNAKTSKSSGGTLFCGACNTEIIQPAVYFKCGNCKCFFVCEECEKKNEHGHTDGHVFLKLRDVIKPQFANKVLLKHLILSKEPKLMKTTSSSTATPASRSVMTSVDLISFESTGDKSHQVTETEFVVHEEKPGNQNLERSSSESTFASLNDDPQIETTGGNNADEEDDDFLVIPLPPCFDLNAPLFAESLPTVKQGEQTTHEVQPDDVETDSQASVNINKDEKAIQTELDRLVESMSTTGSNSHQQPVQESPLSVMPSVPPTTEPIPDPTPYPYVPSPPSLVQQAASVFDSTPADISLTPRNPMDQLIEMGFGNRRLNSELLEQYHGNVEHVIAHLLAAENGQFQSFY